MHWPTNISHLHIQKTTHDYFQTLTLSNEACKASLSLLNRGNMKNLWKLKILLSTRNILLRHWKNPCNSVAPEKTYCLYVIQEPVIDCRLVLSFLSHLFHLIKWFTNAYNIISRTAANWYDSYIWYRTKVYRIINKF